MTAIRETLSGRILRSLTSGRSATYAFTGRSAEVLEGAALARRIAGTAHRLRQAGLDRGQVLPLLLPTSADLWSVFPAAMAADLVPANLALPTFKTHLPTYLRNLEVLMERYGVDSVAASKAVRERLSGAMSRSVRWLDIDELRTETAPGSAPEPSSATAFLQHSSGSTGVPKGVALSHRAVVDHLDAYAEAIHLDPARDRIASWLPLYHDMGLVTSFLLPLSHGVPTRSWTPEDFILDPLAFIEGMAADQATLSWWPNFAFALLSDRRKAVDVEAPDLSSIRSLTNCSEVVMASSIDRFLDAFSGDGLRPGAVQASYAMAENVFAVTQTVGESRRLATDPAALVPGGKPVSGQGPPSRNLVSSGWNIKGVGVRIVGEDRSEVEEGIVGEIAVSGPFLFDEYLRLPEETSANRAKDWYFTRDFGFRWQGELYVLGRSADLIVVGGRKFLANDVERVAGEIPGVKPGRVVAFGVRSEARGTEEAVALVESLEAEDPARTRAIKRAITQAVLQQLDLALSAVVVQAEGSLIKTSSGKIARNDNRNLYLESRPDRAS